MCSNAEMLRVYLVSLVFLPGTFAWSMGVSVQKNTEPEQTAASEALLVTASENLAKR
jgi:hypothetical protein